MPFSKLRAAAFGEYTLTRLLHSEGGEILTVSKSELARMLNVQKLWPDHVEAVRDAAAKHGVVVAQLGSEFVFFDLEQVKGKRVNVKEAMSWTDKFEKTYGSRAADELWEGWQPK